MKSPGALVCLPFVSLLLACASPAPEAPLLRFGKSLASDVDSHGVRGPDLVHADETGKLWAQHGEQTRKRALASDMDHTGFELAAAARGLVADGRNLRWDWLATLSRAPEAGLSVLRIHDGEGRLAHEEVLSEDCSGLEWSGSDAPELLVGCIEEVWRYRPGPPREAVVTRAQFAGSGNAFGPLSFGDDAERVRAALQIAGGVCQGGPCTTWDIALDEREFKLLPQFHQGTLARVTVIGPRRPRSDWGTKVRADWRTLVSEVARATADEETAYPSATALAAVPDAQGVSFAETHHPQRDGVKATIGLYRNDSGSTRGFGAIAVISPASASAPTPSPAAAAD